MALYFCVTRFFISNTRAARDAVKNFPAKVKNGQKQEKNMDVWKNNEHYFFPDTL